MTAKRRAERRQFKLDRARAILAVAEEAENLFEMGGRVVQPALSGPAIPSGSTWKPNTVPQATAVRENTSTPAVREEQEAEEAMTDVEHLQLTPQEAFFLVWNLDCLTILDPKTVRLRTYQL